MSVHVISGAAKLRRVVLSCDVQRCPARVEPPAAERWRSDTDARIEARDSAVDHYGWTHDSFHGTDYCPDHAESGTRSSADAILARPTATVRNDKTGNPLDRDDYAAQLRARLDQDSRGTKRLPLLTAAEAEVVAQLLDELAGVYLGEDLGTLAHAMAMRLFDRRRHI
jgi:hypothetical protein